MGDIIIEESNYRALALLLGDIFMMIASISIVIYGNIHKLLFIKYCGIVAMVIFFGAFLYIIPKVAKAKKLLTITRDGIIDSSSLGGYGYIAFDDIKEFKILSLYRTRIIAVIPKDEKELLAKLSPMKRLQLKKNVELNSLVIPIPVDLAKDMEPEDILSLLQKRLYDYNRLYE